MPLFPLVTIESERRRHGKGREFSVHLLAHVLHERGPNREIRPSWLALFGTEAETRAVVANLRAGRNARAGGDVLQTPKRWPLRWTAHPVPGGVVTLAYMPALFHLEPTEPPAETIRFAFAPPLWWIDAQAAILRADFGAEAPDAARAALFAAFLDRRCPLPLVHDLHFHLALYRELVVDDDRFRLGPDVILADRFRAIGLDPPFLFSIGQEHLAEIVIRQTQDFHQEEIRRGKTRIAAGGRLLPFPDAPPTQLRLDFALASA